MKKEIYLDYAATTPLDPQVLKEMLPYFSEKYGNPSSMHEKGLEAKQAIEDSRKTIAKILNCNPGEIIFTSSGTESINLALKGIAFANKDRGNHIITSKIEHHVVLDTCKYLESQGFRVTYLDVDKYGLVNPFDVANAITGRTILISIMYSNNEIGTIQQIEEIGIIAKSRKVLFHTDACQSGLLDLDIKKLGVDLLTMNGSKIYGPKGSGILYIKEGIKITPLLHGGGQENKLRSGTENVPGIIGFAKALELIQKDKEKESKRLIELRDYLIKELLEIPKTRLNGSTDKRLPNNVNITFFGVEGEAMVNQLSDLGIYISTGSACDSKKEESSHVLRAIGLSAKNAQDIVRFSLGKYTKEEDINYVIKAVKEIVSKLRKVSVN
ncbi:cysteine desulfurase [Candidatus Pacearchaeota archaeon]|nr:cysteine desulfurase [Candidatus Pacearchaeota archaeon]